MSTETVKFQLESIFLSFPLGGRFSLVTARILCQESRDF
jgi:hypothetical protein